MGNKNKGWNTGLPDFGIEKVIKDEKNYPDKAIPKSPKPTRSFAK